MWMKKRYLLRTPDGEHRAVVARRGDQLAVQLDDGALRDVDAAVVHNGRALSLRIGNRVHLVHLSVAGPRGEVTATLLGRPLELTVLDELHALALDAAGAAAGSGVVAAEIPGLVIEIRVREGQTVKRGEPIVVLEAMKMQNELAAPCDGVVASVTAQAGRTVNAGDTLVVITPDAG